MIDDLSEQYLVDCANGYSFEENDMEWTADGCAGAWPMPYFDFLKKTNGGKILRKKTISISDVPGLDFFRLRAGSGFYVSGLGRAGLFCIWFQAFFGLFQSIKCTHISV